MNRLFRLLLAAASYLENNRARDSFLSYYDWWLSWLHFDIDVPGNRYSPSFAKAVKSGGEVTVNRLKK